MTVVFKCLQCRFMDKLIVIVFNAKSQFGFGKALSNKISVYQDYTVSLFSRLEFNFLLSIVIVKTFRKLLFSMSWVIFGMGCILHFHDLTERYIPTVQILIDPKSFMLWFIFVNFWMFYNPLRSDKFKPKWIFI